MTQKELLYFEDAVGHESSIIKILDDTSKKLQDKELVDYVNNEITIHESIKNDLLKVLENKSNE